MGMPGFIDKPSRFSENTFLRESAHIRGDVAQLGEHHVRNVGVVGSNPIISTTEIVRAGKFPGPYCIAAQVAMMGFEPMRWKRVKKTARRAVFSVSVERASARR